MSKVLGRVNVDGENTRVSVYQEIEKYWRTNFRSPSVREIAAPLNLSTCVVSHSLSGLRYQGLIIYSSDRARDITPVWIHEELKKLLE
jgi:hypothetical protein